MKNIFSTAFAAAFMAVAFALPASAALTCGAAGTEGLPKCSFAAPNEKCCIAPTHVKTVSKPGGKSGAIHTGTGTGGTNITTNNNVMSTENPNLEQPDRGNSPTNQPAPGAIKKTPAQVPLTSVKPAAVVSASSSESVGAVNTSAPAVAAPAVSAPAVSAHASSHGAAKSAKSAKSAR